MNDYVTFVLAQKSCLKTNIYYIKLIYRFIFLITLEIEILLN